MNGAASCKVLTLIRQLQDEGRRSLTLGTVRRAAEWVESPGDGELLRLRR